MRQLTLILSDVYLPEESDPISLSARPGDALAMPSLEWLLRFASEREFIGDWRSWLAGSLELPALRAVPAAHVAASARLPEELSTRAWFATPVAYELHINHVRLHSRGLLRVDAEEGARWCAAFEREFGADYSLHYAGTRGFLLTGLRLVDGGTLDPARLLGADVTPGLRKRGELARLELARVSTEFEFWLHSSPLNAARDEARRPRISSLWLWGGGATSAGGPLAGASRPIRLFGDDLFLAGLARQLRAAHSPAPASFEALVGGEGDAVVELMPLSGSADESLARLESRWFAPLRAALADGTLHRLDLVANDRRWRVERGTGWKFWRRQQRWLEALKA